jgi:hypothetical protein
MEIKHENNFIRSFYRCVNRVDALLCFMGVLFFNRKLYGVLIMGMETRLLYATCFTLLGIVLAVYVLPVKTLPTLQQLNLESIASESN